MWILERNHNSGICVWQVALFSSYFVQIDLQMTFLIIKSKAEKKFLYFKLISSTSCPSKVEFQATNSFDNASIESAYLNYFAYIFQALLINHAMIITVNDRPVFFHVHQLTNVVHLKLLHTHTKLSSLFQN